MEANNRKARIRRVMSNHDVVVAAATWNGRSPHFPNARLSRQIVGIIMGCFTCTIPQNNNMEFRT